MLLCYLWYSWVHCWLYLASVFHFFLPNQMFLGLFVVVFDGYNVFANRMLENVYKIHPMEKSSTNSTIRSLYDPQTDQAATTFSFFQLFYCHDIGFTS